MDHRAIHESGCRDGLERKTGLVGFIQGEDPETAPQSPPIDGHGCLT